MSEGRISNLDARIVSLMCVDVHLGLLECRLPFFVLFTVLTEVVRIREMWKVYTITGMSY